MYDPVKSFVDDTALLTIQSPGAGVAAGPAAAKPAGLSK